MTFLEIFPRGEASHQQSVVRLDLTVGIASILAAWSGRRKPRQSTLEDFMRTASIALASGIIAMAASASAANPVAQTEALVQAFKAVKPAPKDGSELSATDKKANTAAFANLDSFFNWDRLTADPIAPHKAKLNAEQLAEFKDSFKKLIRLVAYPNSGSFLGRATYKLKAEKKGKTDDAIMEAYLAEEDFETTVTFHWLASGSSLQIVDVSFDGASLIHDYSNQFGRIITKSGADGLMKKLRTRLEKEEKASIAEL